MQELDDIELLEQFARENSDAAFAELVRRHTALVYSAAFRRVANNQAAEEITQAVFIILARKAQRLQRGTVLIGWLYHCVRLTAHSYLKTELRRTRREQEVQMQSNFTDAASEPTLDEWHRIAPHLDEGMDSLGEKDRDVLLLRYFKGQSFREVGGLIGTSEDAAKMRVSRATEKLRRFLAKRGIMASTVTIIAMVSSHGVSAAPMGLSITLASSAVRTGAGLGSVSDLAQMTLKTMAWGQFSWIGSFGLVLLFVAGATVIGQQHASNEPVDSAAVTAFKNYLASSQNVARVIYRHKSDGRRFVAATDGVNFFFRGIVPGENPDLPIGARNQMQGTPFVGRVGDVRWQIVGFDIKKAVASNPANPDPYTAFADSSRIFLDGVLNLGPQSVQPGSFVWNGNHFEVRPSEFFRSQVRMAITKPGGIPVRLDTPATLTGRITVKEGLVRGMIIDKAGSFLYEYDADSTLPVGFPTRILTGHETYHIEQFVLLNQQSPTRPTFQPESYVEPELSTLTVVSNGQQIVAPVKNSKALQLLRKELNGEE